MDCSKLLTIAGLVLGVLASVILILPSLNTKKDLDDDYIVQMDKDGKYTQKKHLRERRMNLYGLVLLAAGFVLQLGALFNV